MNKEAVLHSPKISRKRYREEDIEEPGRKKKHKSSNQDNQKLCDNEADLEVTLDKNSADETLENPTGLINLEEEQQFVSIKKKKKKKKKKKNVDKDSNVFEGAVPVCDSSKSKKQKSNSKVECTSNMRVIANNSESSEQNISIPEHIVTSTTDGYRESAVSIGRERKKDLRSVSHNKCRVRETGCEGDAEADWTDEFRKAITSHPLSTKSNVSQEMKRLVEFKQYNKVSFNAWQKICDNLKKEGKAYTTGRFSKQENEQLAKNWRKITKNCPFREPHILLMKNLYPDQKKDIERYIKETNFYVRLGKHLNRPLFSIYNRARKAFNPGNFKGRYSKEEDANLMKMFKNDGTCWQKISQHVGRSGQSLCDRFKLLKDSHSKGPWSKEEDDQLIAAVKSEVTDHCDTSEAFYNYPWSVIASAVQMRTPHQCRERWIEVLAFGETGRQKFSKDLKLQLIHEIMKQNVNHESEIDWIELMPKFDVPSPQFLQNRWRRLRKKIQDFERHTLSEVLERLEGLLLGQPVPWREGHLLSEVTAEDDSLLDVSSGEARKLEKHRKKKKRAKNTESRSGKLSEEHFPDISPACRAYFPDMVKAVEWLRRHKLLFKGTIIEPTIMQMTEREIIRVKEEREEGFSSLDDLSRPTSFLFRDLDDLDLFLDKVRFEQDLRIDCELLM